MPAERIEAVIAEARRRAREKRRTTWCPHHPTPKQAEFLALEAEEALYGGAAGGGKTDALLMAALQYVDVPGYSALLLRRTNPQLEQPDGLISRAHQWLAPTAAEWSAQRTEYRFPAGARLRFGHMQYEKDKYNYQGGQYQLIGFDELTHFSETQYTYLHSRLRRLAYSNIPIRMRAATNPGGIGHAWVKRRFIEPGHPQRPFVPAVLSENPHLDVDEYRKALSKLDPTTRAQLERGEWIDDVEQLVYHVRSSNIIPWIPEGLADKMVWVLAIDAGASLRTKSTAFVVCGWHRHIPHGVWTAEAWAEAGLTPSDYGERIRDVWNRYPGLATVVLDEGALGKGYGRELRRRWQLPVEPAQKQHKRAYRKLLNGALSEGHVQLVETGCEALIDQAAELVLDDRGLDEAKGQENHLTDAWLYGWRRCYAWTSEPPEPRLETEEALQKQAEQELERERAALDESKRRPWWAR